MADDQDSFKTWPTKLLLLNDTEWLTLFLSMIPDLCWQSK